MNHQPSIGIGMNVHSGIGIGIGGTLDPSTPFMRKVEDRGEKNTPTDWWNVAYSCQF